MDIEINTFDGIKLKTANTYVEEDINLSVSDKAFEEILYDGEVENGTLGANKLASLVDGTVTEITAEDLAGVTSLRDYAFDHSNGLISVSIPNTVTSIGKYALANCPNLISVTIPENIQLSKINDYTFIYSKNLANINIPRSVTSIGLRSFEQTGLINVTIPNTVETLGSQAFDTCKALQTVTFEDNSPITNIGSWTFGGCENLTSINIPSGVTSIGNYAFRGTKLTILNLPKALTYIGSQAFESCTNLTSVTIPTGVTELGSSAFHNCKSLTSVIFEEDSQLTKIGDTVFIDCKALINLTIPASVTSIGYSALKIGSSTNKATIRMLPRTNGETPPSLQSSSIQTSTLQAIEIPENEISAYSSATQWSNLTAYFVPYQP